MIAFDRVFATEFQQPGGASHLNFSGRTDPSILRDFFKYFGMEPSPDNYDRFFDPYYFWLDYMLHEMEGRVLPGVVRLIEELKALPEPPLIGLLTGNVRLGAEIKLRHYQLWHHFEMGGFGDDNEDRNQIAVVAKKRGEKMLGRRLKGSDIVVVGDTPHDINCARAIKAPCLAVATGGCTREELAAHKPRWLVDDLSQISAHDLRRKAVRAS